VHLAQRPAHDGRVLGGRAHLPAVDQPKAGDDAVAVA
jgi:hypothetical protein